MVHATERRWKKTKTFKGSKFIIHIDVDEKPRTGEPGVLDGLEGGGVANGRSRSATI